MISLPTSVRPLVSILVLSHDNNDQLAECLASIGRSVDPKIVPYEVIVLFWQMSPQSVSSFLAGVEGIHPLQVRLNLGFPGGNNYAAKRAKGEYLVLLNDDTSTQPGWLEHLVRTARSDASIGAVGSRLIFPDQTLQEGGVIVWSDAACCPLGRGDAHSALTYSYVRDVDYSSANGLLVRRSVFESAGGLDESFYPGYYEDVDLCMTIRHRLGLRIVYEPRSVIVHHESVTMKRDPEFRDFLFRRNRARILEKWADELVSYPPSSASPIAIEHALLRRHPHLCRVLVIDDTMPYVGMGCGYGRMFDIAAELTEAGFFVAFHPASPRQALAENSLADLGVDLVTEPLLSHLARPEKRYDAVVISRPHNFSAFAPVVRELQPDATIVYDAEALYHRRLAMQAASSAGSRRLRVEDDLSKMIQLESEIARSADALVMISESERDWLGNVEGHAPIHFMRPLSPSIRLGLADPASRSGAVFVAGWLDGENSPNVAALRWYAREVVPRVRARIPGFVTRVTGAKPPLSIQRLMGDGIELLGFVDSVDQLYAQARIAIAPILAGAGVKIKTIEALQHGVPVVATTVGAEGLGLSDGTSICVTDDPAAFAERVIELAVDDAAWLRYRTDIEQQLKRWEAERGSWHDVIVRTTAARVVASR